MIYISAVGMINALGNNLDEVAANLARGVAPGMRPRAGWLQGHPPVSYTHLRAHETVDNLV
ncbi:beta-ketoacyl-ACP synthase, partial [Escherichia coli]|nr:beta-ketoacyl-ACP synthase [Escherichia coli]